MYPLSLSPKAIPSSRDAEYVGFVSGLRLGQESVARSMLAEWITGAAGDTLTVVVLYNRVDQSIRPRLTLPRQPW